MKLNYFSNLVKILFQKEKMITFKMWRKNIYDPWKNVTATYDWAFTRHVLSHSLWRHTSFPYVVYGKLPNATVLYDCKSYFWIAPPPKGRGLTKCDIL